MFRNDLARLLLTYFAAETTKSTTPTHPTTMSGMAIGLSNLYAPLVKGPVGRPDASLEYRP